MVKNCLNEHESKTFIGTVVEFSKCGSLRRCATCPHAILMTSIRTHVGDLLHRANMLANLGEDTMKSQFDRLQELNEFYDDVKSIMILPEDDAWGRDRREFFDENYASVGQGTSLRSYVPRLQGLICTHQGAFSRVDLKEIGEVESLEDARTRSLEFGWSEGQIELWYMFCDQKRKFFSLWEDFELEITEIESQLPA